MTTVAVMADPPVDGFVLPELDGPLSAAERTALYTAMLSDVCRAVEASGAELLVNYRPDDQVPDGVDPETAVRDVLDESLEAPGDARYEVQVGSTHSARVGNTVTHLLEREGVKTAAAVDPTSALLTRQLIDSAAMKLRSSGVVLGPATDGRVYYAGFADPVDFEDAYETPAVETLTDRGADADLNVDFLPSAPIVETPADLRTVVPLLRARRRGERVVPPRTTALLEEFGLRVETGTDGPELVRP
jgi:2-phospho-L-lactate guanylyltransferase (CobY/MobA/RfbA family)